MPAVVAVTTPCRAVIFAAVTAPGTSVTGDAVPLVTVRAAPDVAFAAETAPAVPATAAVEPVYAIPKRP